MTANAPGSVKAFTSYDVQMCLFDQQRVDHFRKAITEVVRPGDVVVDAGSGTGVLGFFAAMAGAARVYCVEHSADYAPIIEENARRNGLADRVVVIHADATTVSLPEPQDVIICEVLSAGLMYEPQLQIVDNLRRYLRPGGTILPRAVANHVELLSAQSNLYGLRFDFEPRWKTLDDVALTSKATYLRTDFYKGHGYGIDAEVCLAGLREGTANAVRISYTVHFTETLESSTPSDFLLNPQIIFLPEPVPVVAGGRYRATLRYEVGCNPRACQVSAEEWGDAVEAPNPSID